MAHDEEYYETQEGMDATAHGSQRALFEHLLLITLEGARAGKQDPGKVQALLDAFNAASESTQRMVGLLRRAEARKPAPPPCESHLLAALSTGHLTEEEARSLENAPEEAFPFTLARFEAGWFVSCTGVETTPGVVSGAWPHLHALRLWANSRGFSYVLLDRDADPVPDLPYYEW